MTTVNSKIVVSKKCNICDEKIFIVSNTFNRPNDTAFKRTFTKNVELEHYCDGGESKFITAHEINDKEYFEYYSNDSSFNNYGVW